MPDSGDICTCGHAYGSHSKGTVGRCRAREEDGVFYVDCPCPHWRQPVWDMAGELEACIAEEAHIVEDNPAAHDAWQLALQYLAPLREALERARDIDERSHRFPGT